jgi:hypothetical protein
MHEVIKDHGAPHNRKLIEEAFGSSPNIRKITKNIAKIMDGQVKIGAVNDPVPDDGHRALAKTSDTGIIRLTEGFHAKDLDDRHDYRGGVLIHEASHALLGTTDYFSKETGRRLTVAESDARDSNTMLKGCTAFTDALPHPCTNLSCSSTDAHSKDFELLKKKYPDVMHTNADSYKKFGHVVMEAARQRSREQSGQHPGPSHASYTVAQGHGRTDPPQGEQHPGPSHASHTAAQGHGRTDPHPQGQGSQGGQRPGPSQTGHTEAQSHGQSPPGPVAAPRPWQKVRSLIKGKGAFSSQGGQQPGPSQADHTVAQGRGHTVSHPQGHGSQGGQHSGPSHASYTRGCSPEDPETLTSELADPGGVRSPRLYQEGTRQGLLYQEGTTSASNDQLMIIVDNDLVRR